MGPNVLWLTENLTDHMQLEAGMRVLDMGAGKGLSSVFLAKEFGVRVWANDLWIKPEDIWATAQEAGVADQVCPIRAEARKLPYAEGFFDAIVCVDSYAYYGTDDLYLPYFARFVKPGGQIGVTMAGLTQEFDEVPEHLTRPQQNGRVFWDPECTCFHTTEWWKRHFAKCGLVTVEYAEDWPDGCQLWKQFEDVREQAGGGFTGFPSDAEALERDGGRFIAFPTLVARRKEDAKFRIHCTEIRLER